MRDKARDDRIEALGSDLWDHVFHTLDSESGITDTAQAGELASVIENIFKGYLLDHDQTVSEQARELAETWINGNITDTIRALQFAPPITAIALALGIASELPHDPRSHFKNTIKGKASELWRELELLKLRRDRDGEGEA